VGGHGNIIDPLNPGDVGEHDRQLPRQGVARPGPTVRIDLPHQDLVSHNVLLKWFEKVNFLTKLLTYCLLLLIRTIS
jgi:hypothetical protein